MKVRNPDHRPQLPGLGPCSPLRRVVWQRDGDQCQICGVVVRRHKRDRYDAGDDLGEIDHIIPKSKGGPHVIENLQLLCKKCNRAKGAKVQ